MKVFIIDVPPKSVLKVVSSKFLTKQPISVPTSHLVVTLSLYIFGIVCLNDCYICHIHVIFIPKLPFSIPS